MTEPGPPHTPLLRLKPDVPHFRKDLPTHSATPFGYPIRLRSGLKAISGLKAKSG